MTELNNSSESKPVTCETCLTELPKSEALSTEVHDYVMYFCGNECFEKWKQDENQDDYY